jgi:putative transposase
VIKQHNLLDIRTRARHPESNGIVERFNGTVRDETNDRHGDDYLKAGTNIDAMVLEHNNVRLHASLGYIEPREVHFGSDSTPRSSCGVRETGPLRPESDDGG